MVNNLSEIARFTIHVLLLIFPKNRNILDPKSLAYIYISFHSYSIRACFLQNESEKGSLKTSTICNTEDLYFIIRQDLTWILYT